MVDEACRDLHDMAAALLLHLGDGQLRDAKEAGEVDAQDRRVIGLGILGKGLCNEDAGIVDQRVDAAEAGDAFGNRALGGLPVGDVAGHREDVLIARRLDGSRGRDHAVVAIAIRVFRIDRGWSAVAPLRWVGLMPLKCRSEATPVGRHSFAPRANALIFRPRNARGGIIMDRLDAMKVFVVAVDEGSLAAAGRKLGRSPAAVSRAIAFLEKRIGTELLHRMTRSIKLSEEGERYVAACRRVLRELEEADIIAAGERAVPHGTLTLTAPEFSGEIFFRPILESFLDAYPTVSARLLLLDRPLNLIEEGIDIALRVGNLADSSMVATRVGEVRRVLVAAPKYLRKHPRITEPSDLAKHQIIAMAHLPNQTC
jgi:molybdenum-dependent DNA-binding transcriptional regulator ModE